VVDDPLSFHPRFRGAALSPFGTRRSITVRQSIRQFHGDSHELQSSHCFTNWHLTLTSQICRSKAIIRMRPGYVKAGVFEKSERTSSGSVSECVSERDPDAALAMRAIVLFHTLPVQKPVTGLARMLDHTVFLPEDRAHANERSAPIIRRAVDVPANGPNAVQSSAGRFRTGVLGSSRSSQSGFGGVPRRLRFRRIRLGTHVRPYWPKACDFVRIIHGAIKFEVQHLPRVRCAHAKKNLPTIAA
jgi:hypothetical protein